jgi:retron-type reverse transcriptase
MKRYNNLFEKIIDIDNLLLAHYNARKGKTHYSEVQEIDTDPIFYCKQIQQMLLNNQYTVSEYRIKEIYEPKHRIIHILPYYPDRIIQHAIMQIINPIFESTFIHTSYAARKGKGLHDASYKLREYLQDKSNTLYCLQFDIQQFYPSINHNILKSFINKKIKCKQTLNLINTIIDSNNPGIPIGNYISQLFGNIYLNELDHYIKEQLQCKYYIRYCDDGIILDHSKYNLINIKQLISLYLHKIYLTLKSTTIIFPSYIGINFLGYIHYNQYIKLRKSIKLKMIKTLKNLHITTKNPISIIASYKGWLIHCNGKTLYNKYIGNISYI